MVPDSDASESASVGEKTPQQSLPAAIIERGVDTQPRCSQQHVLNCQFNHWYSLFKHCTPRSVVLELSEDVVDYLQGDGVLLPKGFDMSCGKGAYVEDDDEVDWDGSDDDGDEDQKVRHCCTVMLTEYYTPLPLALWRAFRIHIVARATLNVIEVKGDSTV